MSTGLFVIRQVGTGYYWNCSTEHGTGWNEGKPKQSFTKSELTAQIRSMIDNDWLTTVEIVELRLP